jgi:phytoene dehydrogenase-like protein
MVGALVRGLEKRGGLLLLGAHVEQVVMEGGRAAGVALRGGGVVSAR